MKNEMWFEKLFDFVFSSCELWYKKPEDNFYLKILDTLENNHWINKEEILFFDDSKKNVNKANELWIKSYLYTNYEEYEKIINKLN
jgi:FMN phosphatase YigB (HAD superfamily)